jgi:hypothetical protein
MAANRSRRTAGSRRPKPSRRMQPFRQGRFDELCSVYAIINALHLTVGDAPHYDGAWPELYSLLITQLDCEADLASFVLNGVPAQTVGRLLDLAVSSLNDEFGLELSVEWPIDRHERLSAREVLKRLATSSRRRRHSAVLLWIKQDRHIKHWTVLVKANARSFTLLDSAGGRNIPYAACRMSYEPARAGKDEAVLKLRRIYLIRRGS